MGKCAGSRLRRSTGELQPRQIYKYSGMGHMECTYTRGWQHKTGERGIKVRILRSGPVLPGHLVWTVVARAGVFPKALARFSIRTYTALVFTTDTTRRYSLDNHSGRHRKYKVEVDLCVSFVLVCESCLMRVPGQRQCCTHVANLFLGMGRCARSAVENPYLLGSPRIVMPFENLRHL